MFSYLQQKKCLPSTDVIVTLLSHRYSLPWSLDQNTVWISAWITAAWITILFLKISNKCLLHFTLKHLLFYFLFLLITSYVGLQQTQVIPTFYPPPLATTNVSSAIHIILYPLSLAIIAWPSLNVTKSFSKTGCQVVPWSPLIFAILFSTGSLMSLTAPCFPLPLPLKCWRSSEFHSIGPYPFSNSPRAVPSTPTASATESFNEMYIQGPAQVMTPFYCKIFYYKLISMEFYNVTRVHSSTPYDILGEMFKLKL